MVDLIIAVLTTFYLGDENEMLKTRSVTASSAQQTSNQPTEVNRDSLLPSATKCGSKLENSSGYEKGSNKSERQTFHSPLWQQPIRTPCAASTPSVNNIRAVSPKPTNTKGLWLQKQTLITYTIKLVNYCLINM